MSGFTCRACGEHFAGLSYFERHRIGAFTNEHPHYGRRCRTPDEMRAIGLELVNGAWRDPEAVAKVRSRFNKSAAARSARSRIERQPGSPP